MAKSDSASATPKKKATKRKSGATKNAGVDREQIGERIRVFALAKLMGLTSKELVAALADQGVTKVAQSTLTRAEAEQLIDAFEGSPQAETAEADVTAPTEEEAPAEESPELAEVLSELSEGDEEELLTDVESEITPAPEDDEGATDAYAPIFKAPSASARSTRRRASRSSDADARSSQANADEADVSDDNDEAEEKPKQSRGSSRRGGSRHSSRRQAENRKDEPVELIEEPKAIKGSSRLEAQRRRRTERREEDKKRSRIVSQKEFLARREAIERTMVVRERARHDGAGTITEMGVLEDGAIVEHFVTSDQNASIIGNIYLGRVQNVLPSMEAAFIDIGLGRNGVLYAGEVDWKAAGLGGRSRKIEQALKTGDQVLVQVTKDPVGHKGARLTTQISLAGRYLVFVPGGRSAGISRKLPGPERKRLKEILEKVAGNEGGTIIRTAAEGVPEEAIVADVERLHTQWDTIQQTAEKKKKGRSNKPVTLYEEPDLLIKVVRDMFNEDFSSLIVDGKKSWNTVRNYVETVAPDLLDRVEKFSASDKKSKAKDAFALYDIDEQLRDALQREIKLPSGGSLVIDKTEAMTVIDVNTGRFTGSGGSLEETVTSNNIEAAEEIVRMLRLRDIGGMIIIDFIDMILPENQDLVLRRLNEALLRDRTRYEVSEVTSLGLVQLTRKRIGAGLLETFSTTCECCNGRGLHITDDPVEHSFDDEDEGNGRRRKKRRVPAQDPGSHPAALAMQKRREEVEETEDSGTDDGAVTVELDDSVTELIDAVIVDVHDADDTSGAESEDGSDESDRPRRRASRRRGRRGSGRGKGRADSETKQDGPAEDESVADETSVESEIQGEASSGDQEKSQTYEEALEEFKNSPRRKRATRGNSRSDHAPRMEDFENTEFAAEEETAVSEEAPKRASRGRRRATRKTTGDGGAAEKSAASKKTPADKEDAVSKEAAPAATEPSAAPRAKGRRRATRRTS